MPGESGTTSSNLRPIKTKYGIPPDLEACRTALVDGYVVEGHVPADVILRLLRERPKAIGVAVPGMPTGSPGMEVPWTPPADIRSSSSNGTAGPACSQTAEAHLRPGEQGNPGGRRGLMKGPARLPPGRLGACHGRWLPGMGGPEAGGVTSIPSAPEDRRVVSSCRRGRSPRRPRRPGTRTRPGSAGRP